VSSLYEKPPVEKLVEELRQLKAKAYQGGGEERIKFQHSKGKLTARERLALLFDEGTFMEIGLSPPPGPLNSASTSRGSTVTE